MTGLAGAGAGAGVRASASRCCCGCASEEEAAPVHRELHTAHAREKRSVKTCVRRAARAWRALASVPKRASCSFGKSLRIGTAGVQRPRAPKPPPAAGCVLGAARRYWTRHSRNRHRNTGTYTNRNSVVTLQHNPRVGRRAERTYHLPLSKRCSCPRASPHIRTDRHRDSRTKTTHRRP